MEAKEAAEMLDVLLNTIFEHTYEAREVLRERKEKYGEWSREYELAHARFSALYTVLECSGMDVEYQNWKVLNKKGE